MPNWTRMPFVAFVVGALSLSTTAAGFAALDRRDAAARPMCQGPLSAPAVEIPAGQTGFGRIQRQPPLPLAPGHYVLTIDDGPMGSTTPALLEILRDRCVPATFMLIGHRAQARPDLVRRILAEGHGIGSHSFSHPDFGRMSEAAIQQNILDGADAVERAATGRPRPPDAPRLFRLPGASGLPPAPPEAWLSFLAAHHFVLAGYDASPQDWRHDAPQASFDRLFHTFPDRGVIVIHDGQPPTLVLLPMIIDELLRRHAHIVALHLKNGDEP